ncbi:hypothetical protein RW1_062_00120 [Rhodococcus wratislaviensis NBRC 100605]|uniref:Uncharacterized protein n=1 Tax=Rhodococcus wratislaviensis NBRC 100605 TaxID=1219028 RepID=X0PZ87_RHOWR|nr:hypothetical protein RW1_062_00120 [Rhodococcus wratislaviensis NBRC 100605]
MLIKSGERLRSTVCETEVVVVRVGSPEVDVTCGGAQMAKISDSSPRTGEPASGLAGGSQLGKRYEHPTGLELLVTKAGTGSLGVGAEVLTLKESKPLPSSD